MPLTDVAIRKANTKEKAYKLSDSHGLFLFIAPSGTKSWRLKYRFDGKEKLLTFGRYPHIKLVEAREHAHQARAVLRSGRDPAKATALPVQTTTFEQVARDWHRIQSTSWSAHHRVDVLKSLEREVFDPIGDQAINAVSVADVLAVLRVIEKRGAIETAHRVRQRIESIYGFAISSGLAQTNPGASVKAALAKMPPKRSQPALTDLTLARKMLGDALKTPAQPVTRLALKLLALTAVRPGELRNSQWGEFNEEADEPTWTIPAENIKGDLARKAGDPHVVPLAPEAADCVRQLRALTGEGQMAFPSIRHSHKPMSENAIGYLLNRAGYHGRQTAHGLRATFSTIMNELYPLDRAIIDLMLAHTPSGQSSSEAAYNRAQHFQRRRELACLWAKSLLG